MRKLKNAFQNRLALIATGVLAMFAVIMISILVSDFTITGLMAAASYCTLLPVFMIDGKFKELGEAEFKTFQEKATAEELAGYLNALNAHKRAELEMLKKNDANNTNAINALKNEILEMRSKQVDVMEKALEKQGLTIQKLLDENREKSSMAVIDQIKSELNKNKETLESLKAGKKVDFTFSIKSVGTMLESTNLTGAIPAYMRIPGVNFIAQRMPFILDLIGRGTTTSNVIEWVEEVAGEGGSDYTTEGSKKNQIDADFKTDSERVQKITVFVKVSEEMLADIDFMASYINDKLINQKLQLKLDAELLSGAGGGSAINGILTQATAWAAGSFAGTIIAANEFDVLRTAIDQIMVANFMPNYIVMHPSDVTKMKLTKTTEGQYLFPTFIMPGGTQEVDGIRIIANTGMTAGTFLVMDGTKATAYFKEGINIKTGWSSDDFEKNLRTIIGEVRVANVIEGNDVTAFVTGTFSTAITALEKVTD
jgi:HK97 family phage major capsid protein